MIYTELIYHLIHLVIVGLILNVLVTTALFKNLNWLPTDCNVVSGLLACCNDKLTYGQNVDIFNYVFE